MSRTLGPRTTAPRFGSTVTSPLACSCRSASRTGVRLTPNSVARDSWRRRVPLVISPLRTRDWIVAARRSTRPCWSVVIPWGSLRREAVAHEPDRDTGEEEREDDAQRVPGQRQREQRARDAADGADEAEPEGEREVADPLALQRDGRDDRRRQHDEERSRLRRVL